VTITFDVVPLTSKKIQELYSEITQLGYDRVTIILKFIAVFLTSPTQMMDALK